MRVEFVAVLLASGLTVLGCGGDRVSSSAVPAPPTRSAAPQVVAPVSALDGHPQVSENDFAETDSNRDPFRSYAVAVAPRIDPLGCGNQLRPLLPQYAIDELKLVGIVLGGDYPRAMVTDPNGKGWVVKKGDYIGRPGVMHKGGVNGEDYLVNWRVERVREGELVLALEDRTAVTPTSIRVLPLHVGAEPERQQTL